MKFDTSLIKQRMNCVEYARRIGLPIRKSGDRCKSPLRADAKNEHSFVVYDNFWYDFGASDGGDLIDLCAQIHHKGDRGLAIGELARLTGVLSIEDDVQWQQVIQKRCTDIATCHAQLREQDRAYLHQRRITDKTISELRIGWTGNGLDVVIGGKKHYGFAANRIIIPAYKSGYPVSWTARAVGDTQPKYLKPPTDEYSEAIPMGFDTLSRKSDTLYIAEGVFDFLSIWQSGYPVVATAGGHFGKETLKTVVGICKNYKQVVLTFDNDEPGCKFTLDMGNMLFTRKIPFLIASIPGKYKDVSDYYAAGGEIKDMELQDGITYLAISIKEKEAFKAFARKAARLMDRAELSEMFGVVGKTDNFSGVWLKEVQSSCYKTPPEPVVVREILAAHKLLYVAGVGFYEYTPQGKWTLLNDEVIHGYIADTLGGFATGGKLEPIKKLMRSEVLTAQEFDRKPVVCFVNGTLDLETGNFRDNAEDDYCAIQMPYAYLPDAKCPRFEKFIEEITAEDAKRQENLQFIAGYTLLSDCRYERIFVLTGEGSNGKTIFTKVLERLYGDENVTHIDPQGLTEAFERIHLRASLINIAGEIKSDLSSTEEKMKQIASGESIQACYKGHDFIQFKPRAKLVFACNGQLRASDTSDGLARRLTIIDFPCKFVDFPDRDDPYQHEKDVLLLDKLLAELPGIFNWAYQGYKDLLYYNGFTETDEHQQLMRAFRQASNPVEVFVADLLDNPPKRINRADLYRDYRNWCEDNGHKPLSSTRLHPEFRKCTKKTYEEYSVAVWKDGSSRKERGYKRIEKTDEKHGQEPLDQSRFC